MIHDLNPDGGRQIRPTSLGRVLPITPAPFQITKASTEFGGMMATINTP
jgi:hypothetical protein